MLLCSQRLARIERQKAGKAHTVRIFKNDRSATIGGRRWIKKNVQFRNQPIELSMTMIVSNLAHVMATFKSKRTQVEHSYWWYVRQKNVVIMANSLISRKAGCTWWWWWLAALPTIWACCRLCIFGAPWVPDQLGAATVVICSAWWGRVVYRHW